MSRGLCLGALLALVGGCVFAPSAPPVVFGPQNGAQDMRGFHLRGTVKNLSPDTIWGLRVKVEVVAPDGRLLLSRTAPVVPEPLEGGAQGEYVFHLEKRPSGGELKMTATWNQD